MQGLQPSVVLAVALALTATTGEAQIQERDPFEWLPPQDVVVAEHTSFRTSLQSPDGVMMEPRYIQVPGASFVKVHFSDFVLPPGVYVEVSNPEGTELYRYNAFSRDRITIDHSKGDDGVRRFSAMSISGDTAIVRVRGFTKRFDPRIHRLEIDYVMNGMPDMEPLPNVSHIEKTLGLGKSKTEFSCGGNERVDASCWSDSHPDQYDRAHSVGMLMTPSGNLCTAWRVGSDNRLFTAQHCMPGQEELEGSEIWFNHEAKSCGGSVNRTEVKVTGGELLATDTVLDFALFTVNNFEDIRHFGNLGLDVRNGQRGENIFIPQHGRGDPKQISIESDMNYSGLCEIDDDSINVYGSNTDIGYYCDTASSSSGSPVISGQTGKAIALHHMGGCLNTGTKFSLIWPKVKSHFGNRIPEGDSRANWAPSNEVPEATYQAECDKLSCNFDAVESSDPDGSIAAYQWDFGDGNDSSGLVVEHRFARAGKFNVALTVEDDEGATDTYVAAVSVTQPNQEPSAKFSTACVENRCSLNGSGSNDADGVIENWSWDFGDGTLKTGQTVSHEYQASGSFTITLTVEDDEGATDEASHGVDVQMPNAKPVAAFSYNCNMHDCSFEASGSNDSDGEITGYHWDFGDGASGTGHSVEHSYGESGRFTVSLTVHDDGGKFDITEHTVQVDGVNAAPKARFTVNCDGLACTLDAGTSIDEDGRISSYRWLLGDGSNHSGAQISHAFPASGRYSVRLIVKDNEDQEATSARNVSVEAKREIRLSVSAGTQGKVARAYLKWSGAETGMVRILRNGQHIGDVANNGRFQDSDLKHLRREARYQVCESGTDLCSEEVTVTATR